MKILLIKRSAMALASVFVLLLAVSSSLEVRAQNSDEPPRDDPPAQASQDANWRNLLNLTQDQMTKIRAIRQQNVTEAQAIRRRVRQAQRALDQAIYSDNAGEAEIEQRTRELVEAQATEVRMRALTELSIRRVLTPEQLNTFRRIRQDRMNAQRGRRLDNAEQQRPLRNRRLENGINRPAPGDPVEGRPAGQRQRRLGLPRRIRP